MSTLTCTLLQISPDGTRPNVAEFPDSYAALAALDELSFRPWDVFLEPSRDGTSAREHMLFADWLRWVQSDDSHDEATVYVHGCN